MVLAGAGLEHQQLVELATPMLKGRDATYTYSGMLWTLSVCCAAHATWCGRLTSSKVHQCTDTAASACKV